MSLPTRHRIVIPAELQSLVTEPGTYNVEGRMSFSTDPDGFTQLVVYAEKVTPVTERPKGPQLNIHDHARNIDPEHNPSAYGRHDHEAPPWGPNHRHMNSLRSVAVPPTVVGCINVTHDKVDCFAAGVDYDQLCFECQAALGRSFRR